MNFGREVVKGFKESDEAAELIAKHEGRSSADPSVGKESWCFPIWAGVRLVKGFLNPCFFPKSLYQSRRNPGGWWVPLCLVTCPPETHDHIPESCAALQCLLCFTSKALREFVLVSVLTGWLNLHGSLTRRGFRACLVSPDLRKTD